MPRFNGTGPLGQGPLTGRGMGPCNAGVASKRGLGRRGSARNFGQRMRGGYGYGRMNVNDEEALLKEERRALKEDLQALDERLKELKGFQE